MPTEPETPTGEREGAWVEDQSLDRPCLRQGDPAQRGGRGS
jgi:hypothetical protein